MPFAPGVGEAPIVGQLFWAFSLGPPLAKSQKMADLGVLAKFVITRLYGHLWSRSLQQNVALCLHFKCILIRRWCHLRQGVFEAPIVGLLFWAFCQGLPLAKSQEKRPTIGARKWHHLLISMHLKCKHRATFCCKVRLHKCPYSRVMTNLARTPKSAIFWDFAKGGPRENAQKK